MSRYSHFLCFCCAAAVALLGCSFSPAEDAGSTPDWHPAGKGPLWAVSGLAVVETKPGTTVLLAVHDNKQPGEVRVSLVTVDAGKPPRTEELAWTGRKLPVDLEAAAAVPGTDGEFWLAESTERVWRTHLDREAKAVRILGSFTLPNAGDDRQLEGLDLLICGERMVAVWGYRGGDGMPALLSWAECDPTAGAPKRIRPQFGPVQATELRTPWPAPPARPISELKLDPSGALYLTSALDGGDDGPFASALYVAGTLQAEGDAVQFIPSADPPRLWQSGDRKVEALALLPGSVGGVVLGTDDENRGGALLVLP